MNMKSGQVMKLFLKFRNTFVVLSRCKSKSSLSGGGEDNEVLEKLDYESNLLFGKPLKNKRTKVRKNVKIESREDSEECIYYDLSSGRTSLPNDTPTMNSAVENGPFQPVEKVDSLHTAIPEKSREKDELPKTTISESPTMFPLFNDAKKEYVSSQIYFINPIMKKPFRTFPTVTTILTETMTEKSKSNLNQWKTSQVEEMGQDKFDEQQRKQLQSRNVWMKLIKNRLLGVRSEDLDIAPEFQGCWQSLDCVFPMFSNLKTMEKMVVHPELKYKGMIDSIVEFKNKPVLVSWKKSNKIKSSINNMFDAPIQTAAYIGAINYDENYPFKVAESLLVVSYEDGSKADIFHLKKENCLHYWKMWLDRLHLYHALHKDSELITKTQEKNKTKTVAPAVEVPQPTLSTGFNTSAYTTFTEIPKKRQKKNEDLQPIFPIYNNLKKDYVPGHLYEINPVKQEIYSYYPSVTTILSETKSDSSKLVLERWRNALIAEMGQEGFDKYHKNLLETGSLMHSLIQQRLLGTSDKDLKITPELEGCWKSLQAVFPLLSDIKVTESNVVHEELKYKGIIDCVAEFRGKPMLIDWKKSDKVKASIANTYDAPIQIAAYIGATNYDNLYPFKIEEGLLIYCYVDGTKADIFHLNKDVILRYWNLWLQRLNKYKTMAQSNDLKIEY